MAARVLGPAGHVHDSDDTQVSRDPRHQYGMLTHPTIPVLSASLAAAQKRGGVVGRDFVTAFLTGFEVECKIAEFMLPGHYTRGFHSSGTVGTIGAAAKLLGLRGRTLASAIGLAASFAAGIRANYGTMTKPLHVGRAAENGVNAALLSARGFTADATSLDGRWGIFQIFGGGIFEEKAIQGFGKTFSIVDPGVSITPYPSGILTHQTMDALSPLIKNRKIDASDVEHITVFVGSNILDPIRYPKASDYLEAKFSMAALLAMIVLRRRAGRAEFTNRFMRSPPMRAMQERISMVLDPEIEAQGTDTIRSRIELETRSSEKLTVWSDERYRGGPDNPMSDEDLEEKVAGCTEGLLDDIGRDRLIDATRAVEKLDDATELARIIQGRSGAMAA